MNEKSDRSSHVIPPYCVSEDSGTVSAVAQRSDFSNQRGSPGLINDHLQKREGRKVHDRVVLKQHEYNIEGPERSANGLD